MNPTLSAVLGIVGAVISLISITFVIITFSLNRKKETKEDIMNDNNQMNEISRSLLELNLKIGQIFTTTEETRKDVKGITEQLVEQGKEIAVMQTELNTLDARVKVLETR